MADHPIHELMRQLIEGEDFDSPQQLLRSVSAKDACCVLPDSPYSIATQVAHADFWNGRFLDRLEGKPIPGGYPTKAQDFPAVAESEWPALRQRFYENLARALAHAKNPPPPATPKHGPSEPKLMKVALHTAYHLGQIKLLKRQLRAQAKSGG